MYRGPGPPRTPRRPSPSASGGRTARLEGSPSPAYGASLLMTRGNSHAGSNPAPSTTEKTPGGLREGSAVDPPSRPGVSPVIRPSIYAWSFLMHRGQNYPSAAFEAGLPLGIRQRSRIVTVCRSWSVGTSGLRLRSRKPPGVTAPWVRIPHTPPRAGSIDGSSARLICERVKVRVLPCPPRRGS